MLRDRSGWDEATALVATLAGRTDADDLDAGTERDRPSWQRPAAVLDAVTGLPVRDREALRDSVLRLADLVGTAVGFSTEELAVRFSALDWRESAAVLVAVGRRLDDHPVLVHRVTASLAEVLERDKAAWAATDLGDTVDLLLGQPSTGNGALAVQLVRTAGARTGWPPAWRERLRALRDHPDRDIAALARMVLTAAE